MGIWNFVCGCLKYLPCLKVCELALRKLNNTRLKGAGHGPGSPGNDHSPKAARAPAEFGPRDAQGGIIKKSVQGQALISMILVGSFQRRIFHDSVTSCDASGSSRSCRFPPPHPCHCSRSCCRMTQDRAELPLC